RAGSRPGRARLACGRGAEGPGWIESNTARNLSVFPATANQPCNNVGPGLNLLVGPQDAIRVCVNEDALTIDVGDARSGILVRDGHILRNDLAGRDWKPNCGARERASLRGKPIRR